MKIREIVVAALIILCPLSAVAQDAPTDPMVSYAAYNTAIETGSLNDAATHAMAAWRAAETAWGATNPNTGGLAYNAAWSAMLVGKPDVAVEPARRAVALGALPEAAYKIEEAEFLLSYAEFQVATPEQQERLVQRFVTKIEKVETSWNDLLIVNAMNAASNRLLFKDSPISSLAMAEKALAQIARLEISNANFKAFALFNRGRAHMYLRHHREAVSDLIDARLAYGMPRNSDDKVWGNFAAWHLAAEALAKSNNYQFREVTGSSIRAGSMEDRFIRNLTSEERRLTSFSNSCRGINFTRADGVGADISFPREATRDGLIGGVVARLKVAADGKVERVTVLGVVPNDSFSRNAEAAVMTWRYNFSRPPSAECRENYILSVIFAFH